MALPAHAPTDALETTRDRLLAAATDVFSERGYDGAGVQEIARRAGLTTGAIYANFSGKAELLLEAIGARSADELDELLRSQRLPVVGGRAAGRDRQPSARRHRPRRPPRRVVDRGVRRRPPRPGPFGAGAGSDRRARPGHRVHHRRGQGRRFGRSRGERRCADPLRPGARPRLPALYVHRHRPPRRERVVDCSSAASSAAFRRILLDQTRIRPVGRADRFPHPFARGVGPTGSDLRRRRGAARLELLDAFAGNVGSDHGAATLARHARHHEYHAEIAPPAGIRRRRCRR